MNAPAVKYSGLKPVTEPRIEYLRPSLPELVSERTVNLKVPKLQLNSILVLFEVAARVSDANVETGDAVAL